MNGGAAHRRPPAHARTLLVRARQCGRKSLLSVFPYWRVILLSSLWLGVLYMLGGKFGILWICASFLIGAVCSARRRSGFSGFSVQNAGFATAAGQLTAADWDAAYRGGGVAGPRGGEESTRAAVGAVVADVNAASERFTAGIPLGSASADIPLPEGSQVALLSLLAAERAARRNIGKKEGSI